MQCVSVLAKHTDHLLRFCFIASVHVEWPTAGNNQKKMEVPPYRSFQAACLPETLGLGFNRVRSGWSHVMK